MKNVTMKNFMLQLVFVLSAMVLFTACNDDDENEPTPDPTGSLSVSDQNVTENNSIVVSSVTLDQNGWIVVHASNATSDGPQVPDIISEPKMVEAGTSTSVEVMFKESTEIEDGDVVYVMLHTDDGIAGTYEFDGSNGLDAPILDASGGIVMTSITLSVEAAPTGTLSVESQMISQNTIVVPEIVVDRSGWVVVHASNADGSPVVPGIISEPVMVSAGSNTDIEVTITETADLKDGDMVHVMLHTDNGTIGEYEFDGANGLDNPIFDAQGNIVMTMIEVASPGMTTEAQVVSANMVKISEVKAAVDGWLVVHADNEGTFGAVLGQTFVEAGTSTDVMVDLGAGVAFAGGEKLWPMLHIESPADGAYTFDGTNGEDGPEVFGDAVIVQSFDVEAPSGSITAMNQIVQGTTVKVSEITMNAKGWLVVHASNAAGDGPEVPGIVSTPVQIEAGTSTDVEVMLNSDFVFNADDKIYLMLHTENNIVGQYEFDGSNGFDGPITTQAITLEAPNGELTAMNQVVSQNKLMIKSIMVDQPSFVVVHRDNGTGEGPVVPGIISEPVALGAGTHEDVSISFKDGESLVDGEKLWVMLHNDNGVVGTYEFDGSSGLDGPITTSAGAIVMSAVTIEAPSITATDKAVTNSKVVVDEVKAAVDGWLVIHEDDGNGNFGAVIGQKFVTAGTSTNVEVDVTGATVNTGDKLFPMLHIESPADGTYGFPDNGDGPEVFNEAVIVVEFTVL